MTTRMNNSGMQRLLFIFIFFHLKIFSADISFMVADMKYSEADGVKVCEIQQGIVSKFSGYDYVHGGEGLIAKQFCEALKGWNEHFFYINDGIADQHFVEEFEKNGWIKIRSVKELEGKLSPIHSNDITKYDGLLYARSGKIGKKRPKNVLVINEASFATEENKLLMSSLFDTDELLSSFKPKWKSYPTEYSEKLTHEILHDFDSKIIVIKPLSSTMGQGVILVEREKLNETLHILFKEKEKISSIKDPSYRYWRYARDTQFIVEEFYPSDPIRVPHLNNARFDGTFRTAFLLIDHLDEIHVHILDSYWFLPSHSIDSDVGLNQKHKSDCFSNPNSVLSVKAPEETKEAVHKQLRTFLPILYRKMLD